MFVDTSVWMFVPSLLCLPSHRSEDLLLSYMASLVYVLPITFLSHTSFLHSYLNFSCEILRFADREFYAVRNLHMYIYILQRIYYECLVKLRSTAYGNCGTTTVEILCQRILLWACVIIVGLAICITQRALSLCVNSFLVVWELPYWCDVCSQVLLVSVGISYYRAVHRVLPCSHSSSDWWKFQVPWSAYHMISNPLHFVLP